MLQYYDGYATCNAALAKTAGQEGLKIIAGVSHADQPQVKLGQNYPNPFTGETTVDYSLPASASQAELVVFDLVTGRVLLQKQVEGSGSATLNCANLPRGIYGYGLRQGGQLLQVRKMSLQK